jgi:hypothetical protein
MVLKMRSLAFMLPLIILSSGAVSGVDDISAVPASIDAPVTETDIIGRWSITFDCAPAYGPTECPGTYERSATFLNDGTFTMDQTNFTLNQSRGSWMPGTHILPPSSGTWTQEENGVHWRTNDGYYDVIVDISDDTMSGSCNYGFYSMSNPSNQYKQIVSAKRIGEDKSGG